MNKPRILTVSSANIELIAKMKRIPSLGETILENNRYDYVPGGKGAISALAVNRLGGESVFCAKLGCDTHGAKLTGIYEDSGINTRFVTTDKKERTGLSIVMAEEGGKNRTVCYSGANRRLRPIDVEDAFTCYPDALLIQFDIPEETVLAAADYAQSQGIPIFIDPDPADESFPLESLGPIEVFSPNETETYQYTGIHPSSIENCLKACLALSQRVEAKYFVLKLGERGVYVYDGKYFKIIAPYNVDVADTTGAGDVFTAALALEYMRTYDIKRASEYANIAAALTISKPGSYISVPYHEDIKKFIIDNQIGFNI